jgi:hypothetical protein
MVVVASIGGCGVWLDFVSNDVGIHHGNGARAREEKN